MILIMRQLISLSKTINLAIIWEHGKFFGKKRFDLNIFLFHMKYGRKITSS